MNLSKKTLLSGLLASTFILTACGSSDEVSESGGETANGAVTLELFSNKAESVDTYNNLIAKFEDENPNIKIQLEAPPEAETVLRTRLTRNDMPDIMSIGGNATYGELGSEGVLKDLSDEDFLNSIQPAYLEMITRLVGTDTEGTFGVPYATNANGVIYNKTLFEEMNMEIPETWDEFIALLDQAKAEGVKPIEFTLQDAWASLPVWNSLGGVLVSDNFAEEKTNGETSFEDAYSEVADKYLKLIEYGEGDIFGVGYDSGNATFAAGDALFYNQGNWAIPELVKNNEDIDLGFFALPASNDASENNLISGVDVLLAVSENSEHPEEALKFIEFMVSEETSKQYIDEQAAFSAVEGVIQENPIFENTVEYFENGQLSSFPDHFYPAGLGAENLIQQFLIEKDKETFLKTLDSEWDKVVNR